MDGIPGWLSWTDIVLSLVAFTLAVMAAPTILQMFGGRARLRCDFVRDVENGERALAVFLQNPRITNKVLRGLRVRRETIQSLTIAFSIAEAGAGEIIDPIRHARIFSNGDPDDSGSWRIALPPTLSVAASVLVARWDTQQNVAVVLPDRLRPPLILPPKQYRADITFSVDGEPTVLSRQFVVGTKADGLMWISA